MRKELYSHSLTLPRSYFDSHPIGVTLSRLTSDTEAVGESVAVGVLSLFTDVVKTVGLFVFLFYLSWKLTLVVMLVLPALYAIITILRRKLRHYFYASREALAEASAYLQECLNGIKTIQLYAAERKVLARFEQKNRRFFKAQTRSNVYDALLYSLIDGLTSITLALMIWYGTGQILSGVITIGILVGFINTLGRIFIPVREFAQQFSLIQRALSALEHITGLFEERPEEKRYPSKKMAGLLKGDFTGLCFKDLSFTYKPDGPMALKGIDFCLKKGERIAIVGATGSGKSTILRLLTKSYGNYSGSILLNGTELSRIDKNDLLRKVALMQQDVFLFDESIAFNISLDRPGITREVVRRSAEYVFADRFIEKLPGKYDYMVKGNGKNLSAGQAQLISFARAIAGKSELILLDEATASVDSVTENLIRKAIEKIFRYKTVIAIAHRLSTIRNSDLILVLKEGEIVERGGHEYLLKKGGYYAELVRNMQSEAK